MSATEQPQILPEIAMNGIRMAGEASGYSIELLPRERIVRRVLHSWSVHRSSATGKWIATICRPDQNGVNESSLRYVQFPFLTEREAKKFCKAYSPPKQLGGAICLLCQSEATNRHCRNCGVPVCDACATRWGARMIPKTYANIQSITVRVCKSCNWLSNAFCMALLQGRTNDAMILYDTGNVNLRTSFADIHREAMFPVHCAVIGGSVETIRWLVETHLCPLSVTRDPKTGMTLSVQTSSGRTLLDLAMTGRPKFDMLVYLIRKGLCIRDTKDQSLATKTLEYMIKTGYINGSLPRAGNVIEPNVDDSAASTTCVEDACRICYEKPMDCVLVPCGHQLCCSECGSNLTTCPVCKGNCSVLRVFRQ